MKKDIGELAEYLGVSITNASKIADDLNKKFDRFISTSERASSATQGLRSALEKFDTSNGNR